MESFPIEEMDIDSESNKDNNSPNDEDSNNVKFSKRNFIGQNSNSFMTDNYEIIKQLGSGGYARVYEVKNKKTGEIRACKHLSKANIKNKERFEREISILMRTDHPSIIKLYEVYDTNKSLFLIMEICKGGELFDRILEHINSNKMYTERHAAEIFIQLMSAIEYCHNNGICHRDLKPENILYLNQGNECNNPIKIIDFGLSQLINEQHSLSSKVGTAYYVAPEILKGKYSEKCDIFSAGVILFILLSGEPPFNGADDNEIYRKIATLKYNFDPDKWKDISPEAIDLIRHMLLPEKYRYSAKDVLKHPWLTTVKSFDNIKSINFDPIFFETYSKTNNLKKIVLTYIASRLCDHEIENLKQIFILFDKDRCGQISFNDFKQGILQLNSKEIDDKKIHEIFNSIDTDKNGKIDYTEFLAATITKQIYLKKERLFEAFCALDIDGSNTISKNELMEVLKVDKIHEKVVDEYISKADKDGDGRINYKEFTELMCDYKIEENENHFGTFMAKYSKDLENDIDSEMTN